MFYVGACNGGVWKTDDYGRTVDADLRRPAHRLHRRHRHRSLEPRRPLRRQRRGPAAARPLHGRRDLQVDGRRTHLAPSRTAQRAADPADRGGSRTIPTGCWWPCWAAPTVRARARRLPLDGRRRDVREGPLSRRGHGRGGRRPRSRGRAHRLRRPLGSAASPVGERDLQRAGQRRLQDDGRRHHLAAHRRAACRRSRRTGWAASGSRWRPAIRVASSRPSKRSARRASTARTTRARPGP